MSTFEFSKKEALFELRFWLQCMGDHTRVIYDSLGADEGARLEKSTALMKRFDALLERARQEVNDQQLVAVIGESVDPCEAIRDLKRDILNNLLTGKVRTSLWPTFYAHALDEVGEFLRILSYYVKGKAPPVVPPLKHDMLWLLDISGHAQAMGDRLDYREDQLKAKIGKYVEDFAKLYIKAIDLDKYVQDGASEFPAMTKFHRDVHAELTEFQRFQRDLGALRSNKEVLGVLQPVFLDHMFREECYYLLKLAQSGQGDPPACDPTSPRLESW